MLLRGARRRDERRGLTEGGATWLRQRVNAAIDFLAFLDDHRRDLARADQALLDLYLACGSRRTVVRDLTRSLQQDWEPFIAEVKNAAVASNSGSARRTQQFVGLAGHLGSGSASRSPVRVSNVATGTSPAAGKLADRLPGGVGAGAMGCRPSISGRSPTPSLPWTPTGPRGRRTRRLARLPTATTATTRGRRPVRSGTRWLGSWA
jgi:hypothetical protein